MDSIISTKIGPVRVVLHNATSAYIGTQNGQSNEVNGVQVDFSLHLKLVDGSWGLMPDQHGRTSLYSSLHVTRRDYTGKEVPEAARKKIAAIVIPAFEEWLRENKSALHTAEMASLRSALASNMKEIEEANEALSKLWAERIKILAQIKNMGCK